MRLQETSGKSVSEIERELGLSHNLLRQWKKRYPINETTQELERSEVEQLQAELRQAKRELEVVRQERDILKKNNSYLREGCTRMKYEQVQVWAEEYPVQRVCAVLEVSESGYYAWLKREPSSRRQANAQLSAHITTLWKRFKGIYGRRGSMLNYKIKAFGWASIGLLD